jgi:predicted AlkP superfamily pyrophosphatase or phosphodiesterase
MKRLTFLFLLLSAVQFVQAQSGGINSPEHLDKPVVVLIAIDGYRYDYTDRFQPPNLMALYQRGARAQALLPPFPSKTFPSHYTIATGMYPMAHGLINNHYYDASIDRDYSYNNRQVSLDSVWYAGTPIWVNAEKQGMVSASYFFVGTEAPVQGIQPTYYYDYDGTVPNIERVRQVIEWLVWPEEKRPHFITLYFSDVDDAGHRYGAHNDEKLREAIMAVDQVLGTLFNAVKQMQLPVNFVVVSDHGMVDISKERLINLDSLGLPPSWKVINNGALAHIYVPAEQSTKAAWKQLRKLKGPFTVRPIAKTEYRPGKNKLHLGRLGDFLIEPELGWYLTNTAGLARYERAARTLQTEVFGEHGYSPKYSEMHGIFYAQGPNILEGMEIPAFESIHIYPFICEILGLPVPANVKGQLQVLQPILKD